MLRAALFATAIVIYGIYASTPSVKDDDVNYYLYNMKAVNDKIKYDEYGQNFDSKSSIKMLVHGWSENADTFWYSSTRATYVAKGCNVILVDWSSHAQTEYHVAFLRVPLVADSIARFIIGLCKAHNFTINKFHLVGHCLGAHVVGFTGKTIYSQVQEKIGRITGLDPSGMTFIHAKDTGRLAQGDAVNVDTVVTDAGGLGLNKSVGHVNFYPNGGIAIQPGCRRLPCSHNRAAVYFHESILSNQLIGKRCGNYANYVSQKCKGNSVNVLGENVNFSVTGDFYLKTRSHAPFGLGVQRK